MKEDMKKYEKLKIVMVGAGSCSFCPVTLSDILLSDLINSLPLEVCLMDIDRHALDVSFEFAKKAKEVSGRELKLWATSDLDAALADADFVVAAIEVDRYHYWSMDFHIPRRYGFRQVYGENGGPGGMFHTLRNLGPTLHIAHRMEELCPDAWLINYTNPEAKLVEAVLKLTKIRAVGVCHGFDMGVDQIAKILERDKEELEIEGCGLNHFGWMTSIRDKRTGEDLYPAFREKERQAHWLANWDEVGLSRMMLRTYGLYPYPGTNHIGNTSPGATNFWPARRSSISSIPSGNIPGRRKRRPASCTISARIPPGSRFRKRTGTRIRNTGKGSSSGRTACSAPRNTAFPSSRPSPSTCTGTSRP